MATFSDEAAGLVLPWSEVPPVWKDVENFDRKVLESVFPSATTAKAARAALWRKLDNNGNGKVSLAEFDDFVKHVTDTFERTHGARGGPKLWKYARPCLIRAFNLANGVATGDDDFVTRSEFRCLLAATQCALIIYRLFDIADTSNDRRVSRKEFHSQLPRINEHLRHFGATLKVTDADFDAIDSDHGGAILLDEAVHFFLKALTDDPNLLKENEEEGP
mmetsp:Transcript_5542/g.18140  ORF Transcript_5542/g.18140 Transcript_5542/m.18140 type:complete len:219 (-) Transcript_5542:213-869(-)